MKLQKRIQNVKVDSYAEVRSQICDCSWGYQYCKWAGMVDPASKVMNMGEARVQSASNGGILPKSL